MKYIKSKKELEKHYNKTNDRIELLGDDYTLEFDEYVKTQYSIYVEKSLIIKSDYTFEAGYSIEAGGFIEAGGSIEAGDSIEAGYSIKAEGFIEAGDSIEAGGFIKAGGSIEAGDFIEAGDSIEAGGFIEAGDSIKAGYMIRADFQIEAKKEITILNEKHKIFAGLYDEEKSYIKCSKLNANIGYGRLELTEEPQEEENMITIKGKKYSEGTIAEALKEHFNLI